MAQLMASQLAYLASEYLQFAQTLQTFQAANGADPNVDVAQLQSDIDQLGNIAASKLNAAMATSFNDAASAYATLTKTTETANVTAASLAAEAAQFSRIAKIAAGMINLATALGSGNVAAVFNAVASIAQASSGH